MKNQSYIFLIFIYCISLYSCASHNKNVSQTQYKQICQSWMGHNINELLRAWGSPQKTYVMPNGNTVYTFYKAITKRTPVVTMPKTTTYNQTYGTVYKRERPGLSFGGDMDTYYCTTDIETNKNGVIVFWRFEGNNCR